ncbi:MAG TPA: hypothetical protein VJN18_26255 [Polyangiaceae bacterium]|nr:hypothetical protein [Polyangiaceae bacterium]
MVESDAFVSSLGKGREAFHSEVTEFSLRISERTAEDFLRHFSCSKIMIALGSRPLERARIVSELTGVHERVANKLSPENSGETLQIALDEGVTTPKDIVHLFQPDDRQRYLNRHDLWAFDVSGEPWKVSPNDSHLHSRAERYTAYILDRAIENLLISHEEIVSALGMVKLAGWLPSELLGQIIDTALKKSDKFTEEDLLSAAPPSSLVTHVPLDYLWERVVVPLIAEGHDYVPKKTEAKRAEAEGGWSLRPDTDSSANAAAIPPAPAPVEETEVAEDEIIETEDEVHASESSIALGVRKAGGGPFAKKVGRG